MSRSRSRSRSQSQRQHPHLYSTARPDLRPIPPDFRSVSNTTFYPQFHSHINPPSFTPTLTPTAHHYTLPPIPNSAPPPVHGLYFPPPSLPPPIPTAVRTHLLDAVLRHHPSESLSSHNSGHQGSSESTTTPSDPVTTLPADSPPHSAPILTYLGDTSPSLYHIMPSAPRPQHLAPPTLPTASSSRVVDLTSSPTQPNTTMPPQTRGMKRRHSGTSSDAPSPTSAPSAKRRKSNTGARRVPRDEGESSSSGTSPTTSHARISNRQQRRERSATIDNVEELDLTGCKADIEEALRRQREEAVRSQQEARDKPLRLSNLTCVICMDTPTDLTATSCGHLFCHTCLMEALIAGESRAGPGEAKKSQCPVCRKNISRNKATDIIPLLLMKKGMRTQPRKNKAVKAG